MKNFLKTPLICIAFFLFNILNAQTYSIRLLSIADENIAFVYNITINPDNSASIVRTSTTALPSDKLGMQIIGTEYTYNPLTKTILLQNNNPPSTWWGIDNNQEGLFGIINGGALTVSCPCKSNGECEVAMLPGGCLTCVGGSCKCGDIVSKPTPEPTPEQKGIYSILIKATSISFTIQ